MFRASCYLHFQVLLTAATAYNEWIYKEFMNWASAVWCSFKDMSRILICIWGQTDTVRIKVFTNTQMGLELLNMVMRVIKYQLSFCYLPSRCQCQMTGGCTEFKHIFPNVHTTVHKTCWRLRTQFVAAEKFSVSPDRSCGAAALLQEKSFQTCSGKSNRTNTSVILHLWVTAVRVFVGLVLFVVDFTIKFLPKFGTLESLLDVELN